MTLEERLRQDMLKMKDAGCFDPDFTTHLPNARLPDNRAVCEAINNSFQVEIVPYFNKMNKDGYFPIRYRINGKHFFYFELPPKYCYTPGAIGMVDLLVVWMFDAGWIEGNIPKFGECLNNYITEEGIDYYCKAPQEAYERASMEKTPAADKLFWVARPK